MMTGPAAGPPAGLAPCPFCREPVAPGIGVCPHCDEDLSQATGAPIGAAAAPDVPPAAPSARSAARAFRPAFRDRRGLLVAAVAGLAAGLFLVAAGERVLGGPLPDLASAARSLRFLEVAVAALFLLELARLLKSR